MQSRVNDLKVETSTLSFFFAPLDHTHSAAFFLPSAQAQNDVLHNHLQSLTSKAAQIQAAAGQVPEGFAPTGEERTIEELHQLVGYLKKEREIVECKLELVQQESTRLVCPFYPSHYLNIMASDTGIGNSGSSPPVPWTRREPNCVRSRRGI